MCQVSTDSFTGVASGVWDPLYAVCGLGVPRHQRSHRSPRRGAGRRCFHLGGEDWGVVGLSSWRTWVLLAGLACSAAVPGPGPFQGGCLCSLFALPIPDGGAGTHPLWRMELCRRKTFPRKWVSISVCCIHRAINCGAWRVAKFIFFCFFSVVVFRPVSVAHSNSFSLTIVSKSKYEIIFQASPNLYSALISYPTPRIQFLN